MNKGHTSLQAWRDEIDAIDSELLRLLNQRAAIACEIATIKVGSGLPAYDPQREKQVLAKLSASNRGPLEEQSVRAIFSSVIQETRRLGTQKMQEQVRSASTDTSVIKVGL
jgi:chorismate mutase-like protein